MGIKNFANSIARTIPLGRRLSLSREHGPLVSSTWGSTPAAMMSPLSFLCDNSPSMDANSGAMQLGHGLRDFGEELGNDVRLAQAFEISVWSFGENSPTEMLRDFTPAADFVAPELKRSHSTWMWTLCADGLEHICKRVETLGSELDCDTGSAWIFLASDFFSCDTEHRDRALAAKQRCTELGVNIFVLGCGHQPNVTMMNALAQEGRPPIHIAKIKSWKEEFFPWLMRSIRTKSASVPGVQNELPPLGGQSLIGDG